jgi:menaquinol-cytochrome c reductase iron-sulfur subunit
MNLTRTIFSREGFFALLILSVGGVATVAYAIPIVAFVLSPLIKQEPKVWRDVGADSSFKLGQTVQVNFKYSDVSLNSTWSGSTQYTAAWLRKVGPGKYVAFAIYCTHLGCPVHWVSAPQIFLCPCHGSVFTANGLVAGGPAPRPLFRYQTRVRNGRVEIKTEQQPTVGFTEA